MSWNQYGALSPLDEERPALQIRSSDGAIAWRTRNGSSSDFQSSSSASLISLQSVLRAAAFFAGLRRRLTAPDTQQRRFAPAVEGYRFLCLDAPSGGPLVILNLCFVGQDAFPDAILPIQNVGLSLRHLERLAPERTGSLDLRGH